jgi:hypothetical protein
MTQILLFLISTFQWYPLQLSEGNLDAYNAILNSNEGNSIIMQYGGEKYVLKGLIPLNGDIFEGGAKVLLPGEYKITRAPENLKFFKRLKTKKYNRYSAVYKEGELIKIWNELKATSAMELGTSSLDKITKDRLRELIPELNQSNRVEIDEVKDEKLEKQKEKENINIYPKRYYFSFILVQENGYDKLIPVLLSLKPVDDLINNLLVEEEEGEEL